MGKMLSKPGLRKRGEPTHPAGDTELEEPLLDDYVHVSAPQPEGPPPARGNATQASSAPLAAEQEREPLLPRAPPGSAPSLPHQLAGLWRSLVAACLRAWTCVRDALLCLLSSLGLARPPAPQLSLVQQERLQSLQERVAEPYSAEDPTHQAALRALWEAGFPGEPFPPGIKSERWKDMGWQSDDPGRDFRGAGFLSLESLLFMAQRRGAVFGGLMRKEAGARSDWEYPFAAAGVNVTYMLAEVLDLRHPGSMPATPAGRAFLPLLDDSDTAFEEAWVACFRLLDRTWLDMGASYMQFPTVLKAVRLRVEQALGRGGLQSVQQLEERLLSDG